MFLIFESLIELMLSLKHIAYPETFSNFFEMKGKKKNDDDEKSDDEIDNNADDDSDDDDPRMLLLNEVSDFHEKRKDLVNLDNIRIYSRYN